MLLLIQKVFDNLHALHFGLNAQWPKRRVRLVCHNCQNFGNADSSFSPLRSRGDLDQLLVYEFTDPELREFAAVAGVLHSAERQVRRGPRRVIDEHLGNGSYAFIVT